MNLSILCEEYVNRSPFLRESINEDLINISALARKMRPEIEAAMKKPVKDGAIIMAIKRIVPEVTTQVVNEIPSMIQKIGDFVVRSGLDSYTLRNSDGLMKKQAAFGEAAAKELNSFYTVCNGVSETTFVLNTSMGELFQKSFKGENIISSRKNLASVTIKLPEVSGDAAGFYYYILKQIAWEGINMAEVVSTSNEFSIIVNMDDIDKCFSVLMRLKKGL